MDEFGKIVYKDSECDSTNDSIRPLPYKDPVIQEEAFNKAPENVVVEDGKPGKLIFLNKQRLTPPYTIKVNEVRLITETYDRLVLDVIYTYKNKIPAEEIKIFVTPNHGYWSTGQIQVSYGKNVGRASIGLSRSNMKKARVKRSYTDVINIRFEHYKPKKYLGAIWSETVKYKKKWVLK